MDVVKNIVMIPVNFVKDIAAGNWADALWTVGSLIPGVGAIKSAMEKLGVESQALGQAIYEATQAEQAAGGGAAGGSSDDDVVDAEVVEDDQEPK